MQLVTSTNARQARAAAPAALPLTTTRLCQATGTTRGMMRLHETECLIPVPQRTAAGYGRFPVDTVDRKHAILLRKEVGLTLHEIALLLAKSDHSAIDGPRLQALAQAQVAKIDARIPRIANIARLGLVRQTMAPVAGGDMDLFAAQLKVSR